MSLVDDGVQPALRGYAARRAREEHELDLLRGCAAGIALGSGGAYGIGTGADNVTGTSLSGGQEGRGAHDVSSAGVDQAGGSCSAIENRWCSSQFRRVNHALGPPLTSRPASWIVC